MPGSMPILAFGMEINIKDYEAPELCLLTIEVEAGFAGSENEGGIGLPGWEII